MGFSPAFSPKSVIEFLFFAARRHGCSLPPRSGVFYNSGIFFFTFSARLNMLDPNSESSFAPPSVSVFSCLIPDIFSAVIPRPCERIVKSPIFSFGKILLDPSTIQTDVDSAMRRRDQVSLGGWWGLGQSFGDPPGVLFGRRSRFFSFNK